MFPFPFYSGGNLWSEMQTCDWAWERGTQREEKGKEGKLEGTLKPTLVSFRVTGAGEG